MSNIFQTLFNTNHDQPSFLVFVILVVIAFVVPAIARYLHESGQTGSSKTKAANTTAPAAKPRHQHKKKKR